MTRALRGRAGGRVRFRASGARAIDAGLAPFLPDRILPIAQSIAEIRARHRRNQSGRRRSTAPLYSGLRTDAVCAGTFAVRPRGNPGRALFYATDAVCAGTFAVSAPGKFGGAFFCYRRCLRRNICSTPRGDPGRTLFYASRRVCVGTLTVRWPTPTLSACRCPRLGCTGSRCTSRRCCCPTCKG